MVSYNTTTYGEHSIKTSAMASWNDMQNQLRRLILTTYFMKNNLITPR